MDPAQIQRLIDLDRRHVWHPFTPMRQWRQSDPIIIQRGQGDELIDLRGRRYIDGVSSLWCNIHGHHVPEIDSAIRAQLELVAHSTLLGLGNIPSIELAARLCAIAPGKLTKVFYSDAGAAATEVAFKMAVGYWFHRGQPRKKTFIALSGAYHGDTTGAMSVGYNDLFHRPFRSMVFGVEFVAPPQARTDAGRDAALAALEAKLKEKRGQIAAVAIEPLVQGAAGMVMQPPGYLQGVERLCREHQTLLIADEVATGFGRTGRMFACEHENVAPDILCLGKGLSGGYLPLAATLCTDDIEQAFCGESHEFKTLFHGHTFTGNPLGCAAALASLELFEKNDLLAAVRRKAELLRQWLAPLGQIKSVKDVRQTGLMVGIELAPASHDENGAGGTSLGDFGETTSRYARRIGHEVCAAAREKGILIRPLGNVVVLMPPPAISQGNLNRLAEATVDCIRKIAAS